MQRDTPYLSKLSPNAGKYGPEKTPYLDTFHTVGTTQRPGFVRLSLYSFLRLFLEQTAHLLDGCAFSSIGGTYPRKCLPHFLGKK